MKSLILGVALSLVSSLGLAGAQLNVRPLPKPALAAKTVAIVNNTHNDAVEEGAVEALKRWGRFTIVDDSDAADITLTFDKKSEHEGTSTQKTGDDGKPDTNYSISFSSSIHMKATLKGGDSSFYSTTTGESKKKAGAGCILDLQRIYLAAPRE
jgi:hypothetical protein